MTTNLFLRAIDEAYADELEPGQLCEAWDRGNKVGLERAERFDLVIDARGRFVVMAREGGRHDG